MTQTQAVRRSDSAWGKQSLRSLLEQSDTFVRCVEIVTSRGLITEQRGRQMLDLARELTEHPDVHALSITDNPGGNAMVGADLLGTDLIARGQEVIIHASFNKGPHHQAVGLSHLLVRDAEIDSAVGLDRARRRTDRSGHVGAPARILNGLARLLRGQGHQRLGLARRLPRHLEVNGGRHEGVGRNRFGARLQVGPVHVSHGFRMALAGKAAVREFHPAFEQLRTEPAVVNQGASFLQSLQNRLHKTP